MHYAVVDLPNLLQQQLPKLKQVLYAPFTPRHGKTDLDRFFGWLTKYLKTAQGKYKVNDIQDLKKALDEGCERSKVDRKAEGKHSIKQRIIIHELKDKAPLFEKRIDLPGLGSVGGVSFLTPDKSIRNHVFADVEPEYVRDLRDRITHTRRTDEQRKRRAKRKVNPPIVPNSKRIYNQAIYRKVFSQRLYRKKTLLPLEELPEAIKLKKGQTFSNIIFEQAIYIQLKDKT